MGRLVFQGEGVTKRNLYDSARSKRRRHTVHVRNAAALDANHDFGEFFLNVRPHAAAPLELTREDRAKRWPRGAFTEVPHQNDAPAAEQTIAAIVGMSRVPQWAPPARFRRC